MAAIATMMALAKKEALRQPKAVLNLVTKSYPA
jgi:hypothetical protein